jgi:tRNA-dihydrouridine synthase
MVGRGMFRNFWIFDPKIDPNSFHTIDRLQLLADHITLWDKTWGETKDFNVLKKFYKVYINGFDGASEMREQLMQLKTAKDTLNYLQKLKDSM